MKGKRLEPIHPGEILREEFMAPSRLSAHALAMALRVPATRVGEIVRGRRAITADTALRLARYFGTSSDLWVGLQAEYDLRVARHAVGDEIEREVHPRRSAAP
jgi:addiction module HigA family antidote